MDSRNEPLLKVRDLGGGYGKMQVIFHVGLEVARGQVVILLGANGAGKTTFLKSLMALIPGFGGSVYFEDVDISRFRTDERVQCGIGYMSELGVFPELTVDENLAVGGYCLAARDVAIRKAELYDALPLLKERKAAVGASLSGGQRKMLGFAKALMGRPSLLLLDEPSAGLAPRIVDDIVGMLKHFHEREGVAMLIAEQNIRFMEVAEYGYVFDGGRVVAAGSINELEQNDLVVRAYLGVG